MHSLRLISVSSFYPTIKGNFILHLFLNGCLNDYYRSISHAFCDNVDVILFIFLYSYVICNTINIFNSYDSVSPSYLNFMPFEPEHEAYVVNFSRLQSLSGSTAPGTSFCFLQCKTSCCLPQGINSKVGNWQRFGHIVRELIK